MSRVFLGFFFANTLPIEIVWFVVVLGLRHAHAEGILFLVQVVSGGWVLLC